MGEIKRSRYKEINNLCLVNLTVNVLVVFAVFIVFIVFMSSLWLKNLVKDFRQGCRYRADSSKQCTHTFTKSYLPDSQVPGSLTHPMSVREPDYLLEHSMFINSLCNATLQIRDNRNISETYQY